MSVNLKKVDAIAASAVKHFNGNKAQTENFRGLLDDLVNNPLDFTIKALNAGYTLEDIRIIGSSMLLYLYEDEELFKVWIESFNKLIAIRDSKN